MVEGSGVLSDWVVVFRRVAGLNSSTLSASMSQRVSW